MAAVSHTEATAPVTPERREEAKRRAERIRQGMTSLAATIKDIATAYAERDWLALDPPTQAGKPTSRASSAPTG